MDQFRNALEQELARLQEELRNDPRARRAEKIVELLTLYPAGDDGPPNAALDPTSPHHATSFPIPPTPALPAVPRPEVQDGRTKAARLKAAARGLLAANGTLHRSALLERLQDAGIMTREGNPMATLAAYLSDWRDEFASDGKGNFSLRPSVTSEPPPAPESGAGSAEGRNPGSDPGLPFNRH
ncbi:hypothetical protein GCM10009416_08210 [Craurococcus roseus]|uniref:HTH HARE-type domain-containing protein n=1 Tax=Craurococcus roseus TaxID=77585 RepID=A0ABN1EQJ0_9PROT